MILRITQPVALIGPVTGLPGGDEKVKYRYLKNIVTLQLDSEKCSGCGFCMEVCPQGVFAGGEKKAVVIADRDACLECGACAKNCAAGAVTVRAGVGCASAVIMNIFKGKKAAGSAACCCSLDDYE